MRRLATMVVLLAMSLSVGALGGEDAGGSKLFTRPDPAAFPQNSSFSLLLGSAGREGKSSDHDTTAKWDAFYFEMRGEMDFYDGGLDGGLRGSFFFTGSNDVEYSGGLPGSGEGMEMSGIDLHGDIGYGFRLNEKWLLTATAGLGYRMESWEWDGAWSWLGLDDYEDDSILYADFGFRLYGKLNDKASWKTRFSTGPILSNSYDTSAGNIDGEGGWVMRFETGLDWKLFDGLGLNIGLSWYREEQDQADQMMETEFESLAFQFGLWWKF